MNWLVACLFDRSGEQMSDCVDLELGVQLTMKATKTAFAFSIGFQRDDLSWEKNGLVFKSPIPLKRGMEFSITINPISKH